MCDDDYKKELTALDAARSQSKTAIICKQGLLTTDHVNVVTSSKNAYYIRTCQVINQKYRTVELYNMPVMFNFT